MCISKWALMILNRKPKSFEKDKHVWHHKDKNKKVYVLQTWQSLASAYPTEVVSMAYCSNLPFRIRTLILWVVWVLPLTAHSWVLLQALSSARGSCCTWGCICFLPRKNPHHWVLSVGLPRHWPLASMQDTSEGPARARTPGGIGWGLCCSCTAV